MSSHYTMHSQVSNGLLTGTPKVVIQQTRTKPKRHSKLTKFLPQILATLAVSIGSFAAGLGKGYSSPAIDSMQLHRQPSSVTTSKYIISNENNNTHYSSAIESSEEDDIILFVSTQDASWIASLSLLGALFGSPFGGIAMKYGRKNIILMLALPFSAFWLITLMAINIQMLFFASFIGGFCCAIILMVSQVYISEISDPNVRGSLSAVQKVLSQIGVLMSFIMGAYLDWRQLACVISMAPILLFITMLYLPETPSYLMLSGHEDEAIKSLMWLKDSNEYDIRNELLTIKNNIIQKELIKSQRNHGKLSDLNHLIHPIFVTCGLMFFQRFSGANAFSFYAVPIFRKVFEEMSPHAGAIAVCFVQLIASLLSGLLIDTIGRLPLLIISSVCMSIALAAFGSYAYYEEIHKLNKSFIGSNQQYDWIPLLCVLIFTVAFSMGISPISFLLISELFPLEYRGLGSALAMSFSYGCAFIGVKTFIDFEEAFGLHGAFWLYSAFSVAGLCFIVCFVPETKGRDLEELDHSFLNRR